MRETTSKDLNCTKMASCEKTVETVRKGVEEETRKPFCSKLWVEGDVQKVVEEEDKKLMNETEVGKVEADETHVNDLNTSAKKEEESAECISETVRDNSDHVKEKNAVSDVKEDPRQQIEEPPENDTKQKDGESAPDIKGNEEKKATNQTNNVEDALPQEIPDKLKEETANEAVETSEECDANNPVKKQKLNAADAIQAINSEPLPVN